MYEASLKKMLFSLMLILFAFGSHAQKDDSLLVNIWADKLLCNKEMEDATADGNGNESFVQYHWAIVNANNGTITKSGIQANLDIKMLFSGSNYPLNKMIIGEYPIRENDILVIVPVVWEQDKVGPDVMPAFNQNMVTCMTTIAGQLPAKYATLRMNYNNSSTGYYSGISTDLDRVRTLSWSSFSGLPSFKTVLEPARGTGATRPVGFNSSFEFTPAIFTFSRAFIRYIEQVILSSKGGIVQFQANYTDESVGSANSRPNYSINISLQRKTITPGVIVRPPITKTPFQVGMWQGTWNASSDPFLKMNISADGFFQLFDAYNNPKQSGTYTMNNDQFNGKLTLNGKNYELTGNLDRSAATLTGTWRYNDGFTTKNGTWSVKK